MDGETLKSRLVALLQKSRKAVRLYNNFDRRSFSDGGDRNSFGCTPAGFSGGVRVAGLPQVSASQADKELGNYAALQLEQWQGINADLQRQLGQILDRPHTRLLGSETIEIRDRFYGMWRAFEAELRQKQVELGDSVARGDFVRAAVLAKAAVILKAREQAAEAAHHEIQQVVDRFKLCADKSDRPEERVQQSVTDQGFVDQGCAARTAGTGAGATGTGGDGVVGRPLAKVIQLRRASV